MPKITVIDSIMGSGKTTAMIQKINNEPDRNFIFITPYLDEVDRVVAGTHYTTRQPFPYDGCKLDELHKLLADGENIAATHALFLRATEETAQLIQEGGYTLILDEALDVLHPYNDNVKEPGTKTVTKGDIKWLKQQGCISVDEKLRVLWHSGTAEDFHYSEVERLSMAGCLRCIDDVLYWEYPADIFQSFPEIFILTYLFEGSVFDAYLKLHGMEYTRQSVGENGKLCPYTDSADKRKEFAKKINIYHGKLNRIGARRNCFSMRWLENSNRERISALRRTMRRYKEITGAKSAELMWTTAKDFHKNLEREYGFKYIRQLSKRERELPEKVLKKLRCFVPCNARATNDFRSRTTLLYLLNRFPNPEVRKYFSQQGIQLDEDLLAISELVQWIWRSAIRDGKAINLFIPSARMRDLLNFWLGNKNQSSDEPHTKRVLRGR